MNLIINFYFMYMRKHGEKGLDAARTVLMIPLLLNFSALAFFLSNYLRRYFIKFEMDSLIICLLLTLIFGFSMSRYLDKKYTFNGKFKDLSLPNIYYLCMPIHYIGSIVISIMSLKYL